MLNYHLSVIRCDIALEPQLISFVSAVLSYLRGREGLLNVPWAMTLSSDVSLPRMTLQSSWGEMFMLDECLIWIGWWHLLVLAESEKKVVWILGAYLCGHIFCHKWSDLIGWFLGGVGQSLWELTKIWVIWIAYVDSNQTVRQFLVGSFHGVTSSGMCLFNDDVFWNSKIGGKGGNSCWIPCPYCI